MFVAVNADKLDADARRRRRRGAGRSSHELIGTADAVVENFAPRVFEQWDLTWDAVHSCNPSAVMMRMPAFGLTGPWRDRVGFAQTMEQMTGMAWVTGFADDQPRIVRGPCDPIAGMHGALRAHGRPRPRAHHGIGCVHRVDDDRGGAQLLGRADRGVHGVRRSPRA